jgi:hypothetical protein
LLQNIQQLLQ